MALLTKLKIQDTQGTYLVVGFRCRHAKKHDRYHPISAPVCEQIEITVVAPTTDDFLLYEWFINHNELSGKLSYELPVTVRNASPGTRCIGFTDARCLKFSEHYDVSLKSRRLLTIVIIPRKVTIDGININPV